MTRSWDLMEVVITQHVSVLNAAALHILKGYWLVLWLYEFYLNQKKKIKGLPQMFIQEQGRDHPSPLPPVLG